MLRQERFGGGMADQKDQDMVLARAIVGDGKFEVNKVPFHYSLTFTHIHGF